jgi:hypothetical protein
MNTEHFWQNIEWMGMHTRNTCRVANSQGQSTDELERDQLQFLIAKCQRRMRHLDGKKVVLNRGNGSKPSEKPCEEFSQPLKNSKD